jgi:hypothetical protein
MQKQYQTPNKFVHPLREQTDDAANGSSIDGRRVIYSPRPKLWEWMMGYPDGWTALED